MRVLVTRPREDAERLMRVLATRGIDAIATPLLDITYADGEALDLSGVQALVFTSANGVRAFAHRSGERALPALCVGDATRREAEALGFGTVKSADGDVQALAALIKTDLEPSAGAVLHPAGSHVAGDLGGQIKAAGFTYRREALYTAKKIEALPQAASQALKAGDVNGVLLYSPRTAAAFAALVQGTALGTVTAYCLSPAVADKVSNLAWRDVKIAAQPDQDALLVLL